MQIKILENVTTAPTISLTNGVGFLANTQTDYTNGGFSVQATVTGTGAVSATVIFQVSNDDTGWVDVATLSLSGTNSDSTMVTFVPSWAHFRAKVTAISGTAAAVSVTIGG